MRIKVLHLNTWYGRIPEFQSLIDFLKQENADVMTLQEIHDGKGNIPRHFQLLSELKNAFPDYSVDFGAAFMDVTPVGNIESGNATLVRGRVLETENIFFDYPYSTFDNEGRAEFEKNPHTVLVTKAHLSGVEVNILNVHGIWGRDGRDSERRTHMIDVIAKAAVGCQNVILAGDFNMNPDTEAIRNLETHLKSVFKDTLTTTFNYKRKQTEWSKSTVVDMMFVSPSIKILSQMCPDVDVSDHRPLVATIEV